MIRAGTVRRGEQLLERGFHILIVAGGGNAAYKTFRAEFLQSFDHRAVQAGPERVDLGGAGQETDLFESVPDQVPRGDHAAGEIVRLHRID